MGCAKAFTCSHPAVYVCAFHASGFHLSGSVATPCGVKYHRTCVQAGPPFKTRLPGLKGLVLEVPPFLVEFVCECCQLRALLDRELLSGSATDHALLMLERMRLIDVSHHWRSSTMTTYGRLLRQLHEFTSWSQVPTLVAPPLRSPPVSPIFGIMYAQLRHSVFQGGRTFQTVRQLRSAASAWFAAAHMQVTVADVQAFPGLTSGSSSLPTAHLMFSYFAEGMSRRMGVNPKPSVALSHAHVSFLDHSLTVQWNMTRNDPARRHEIASAAVVNLLAWLGWLRSGELFSLTADMVKVIDPSQGPRYGLLPKQGAVIVNLLPMTKSNPTSAGDVVVVYTCLSGLSLGKWMSRLLQFVHPSGLLFSTPQCSVWTSLHFRSSWLLPALDVMRLQGESSLMRFSDVSALRQAFYGMHSYRRGGRSRVQKASRPSFNDHPNRKKASDLQVIEHGRWKTRHRGESMTVHYNEWDLNDRVQITWLCM